MGAALGQGHVFKAAVRARRGRVRRVGDGGRLGRGGNQQAGCGGGAAWARLGGGAGCVGGCLLLLQRAEGGLHHAGDAGGVGAETGGHGRGEVGLGGALEVVHDRVVRGDRLGGEHGLEGVLRLQGQESEAGEAAAGGAQLVGIVRGGGNGGDDGVEEVFEQVGGECVGGGVGGHWMPRAAMGWTIQGSTEIGKKALIVTLTR